MKKILFNLLITLGIAAHSHAQQTINKSLNVDGTNRTYIVYVPINFDPSENMPAMFFFHGGGGTASQGIYECDFRSLADSERFMAVYPQAINSTSGANSWDCLGDYHGGIDEMGFMSAMIKAMSVDYNIDTQRVYAGGYSLGGSIVYDIAGYLPDQVAAIAPVAANMWEWTLSDVKWTTPIACIHLLGTNDFYAPYNGNAYSISTSAQNNHFVNLNGAQTPPISEYLGGNITRYTWLPGEDCHGHQHYVRQGGGHDPPSAYPQGPEWIWDYVSQFDINGALECGDSCPADANEDSIVNVSDILVAIGDWGLSDSPADVNDDGTVGILDILAMIDAWGSC
ncbi:MAG: hypothetical protein CMA02_02340 [Euryarchaeota archaeon]|nr:hypothetical protein [Euryarchaeota archaeon]